MATPLLVAAPLHVGLVDGPCDFSHSSAFPCRALGDLSVLTAWTGRVPGESFIREVQAKLSFIDNGFWPALGETLQGHEKAASLANCNFFGSVCQEKIKVLETQADHK